MTTNTNADGVSAETTIVPFSGKSKPRETIGFPKIRPRPIEDVLMPLRAVCGAQDNDILAVERQAFAVAEEAARLDKFMGAAFLRLEMLHGPEVAAQQVAEAVTRGKNRRQV